MAPQEDERGCHASRLNELRLWYAKATWRWEIEPDFDELQTHQRKARD